MEEEPLWRFLKVHGGGEIVNNKEFPDDESEENLTLPPSCGD